MTRKEFLKYLLSNTRKNKIGCLEWLGPRDGDYGRTIYRKKIWRVHRLVLFLSGVRLPAGKVVCHRCDNMICVNPDHLCVASQTENMLDYSKKGSSPLIPPLRNKHGQIITILGTLKE